MFSRKFISFPVTDLIKIKQQVLNWSASFDTCCFLDNQQYTSGTNTFECIAAVGEIAGLKAMSGTAFDQLRQFSSTQKDWLFGHFSFDLKSETESVPSRLPDNVGFPDLFFFVPEIIVLLNQDRLSIGVLQDNHGQVLKEIQNAGLVSAGRKTEPVIIRQRIPKAEYLEIIQKLKKHIFRGDCYEINFCQEFYAEDAEIDPAETFQNLIDVSPNPFSAFYRLDDRYLICASPERFIAKKGRQIFSQPMKGTSRRDLKDREHDEVLRRKLEQSAKERSENVMVVDMVRNDLTKVCTESSVKVDELFGVYSYPQVHQMISTISGELKEEVSFSEIIGATFPMGSMTGAPKYRVMELIDQYEESARGIFSGSVGYISPGGDFDFNVVIRSIMYNTRSKYLSYQLGSGITFYSDPEKEWEECLLKGEAIKKVLTAKPAP